MTPELHVVAENRRPRRSKAEPVEFRLVAHNPLFLRNEPQRSDDPYPFDEMRDTIRIIAIYSGAAFVIGCAIGAGVMCAVTQL